MFPLLHYFWLFSPYHISKTQHMPFFLEIYLFDRIFLSIKQQIISNCSLRSFNGCLLLSNGKIYSVDTNQDYSYQHPFIYLLLNAQTDRWNLHKIYLKIQKYVLNIFFLHWRKYLVRPYLVRNIQLFADI